jgi:peptide/nickel transport system substrate-binding protein
LKENEMSEISRRKFLKVSALAASGVIAAACAKTEAPTATPAVQPTATPVPTQEEIKVEQATATPVPTVETAKYNEAPMLAELVQAGTLPSVDERLPNNPKVLPPYADGIGQYGGAWRRGYKGASDRWGVHTTICEHLLETYQVEGGSLSLVANVADSYEVNADGTVFTWNLREGMKWSDGTELVADSAVWWFDHILGNEEIAPGRKYDNVRQQEHLQSVTADGKYTFVLTYSQPNGTLPLGVVRGEAWGLYGGVNFLVPDHYLKDYHVDTADADALQKVVEEKQVGAWSELFREGPIAHFAKNPELPVLGPWVTTGEIGGARMVQQRNPYYFQVDTEGNQLPYMDEIWHDIFENQESFNLMMISGNVDCQLRHVQVKDFTLLKENTEKGGYRVLTWRNDGNSGLNINPTPRDEDGNVIEELSEIMSRRDFRIAVAYAINREEINDLIYNGLATVRGAAPVPGSPVWKKEYEEKWTEYDPDRANELLDGLGLDQRDADGFRKLPNGETFELRIDYQSSPGSAGDDQVQLVGSYLEVVGIKILLNGMERSLHETYNFAGRLQLSPGGRGNTAVPLSYDGWHNTIGGGWGAWIRDPNIETAIEPPADDPEVITAKQCFALIEEAYGMLDVDAAHAKLMEALDIYYEQCYDIGIVGANLTPGVVTNRMKNVPDGHVWGNALMRINAAQPPQMWIEE